MYQVEVDGDVIAMLIALKWLSEGDEVERHRVGEAIGEALRELAPWLRIRPQLLDYIRK
jgi:hypothetical protein